VRQLAAWERRRLAEELGITAALGKGFLGELALFLVLVRLAQQGSRLSAVRWAEDHAVAEILGLTGLLEVRPVFVRQESRTRGHVFACMLAMKISREMERRLQAAFSTTGSDPHTITLTDALASLSRLCLLHYPIDADTIVTRLPRPDVRQKQILAPLHAGSMNVSCLLLR
jgi:hypothetical protein